jgi:hypothetical protein
MPSTTQNPNYSRYQSTLLVSVPVTGTPSSLPAADRTIKKPEKIMVQAHPFNTGPVLIGQDNTLAYQGTQGGFYLAPGEMFELPDNTISVWRVRGTGEGGQGLIVTYLSGAN